MRQLHKIFGTVSLILVLLVIVWGFLLAGSPTTERARRFDDRRIQDLQGIQNEILLIVTNGRKYEVPPPTTLSRPFPKTLEEAAAMATYQKLVITDPETGAPYEYQVLDQTHFQLCATFNLDRDEQYDIFWNHPAGYKCFVFDALASDGKPVPSTSPAAIPPAPAPVESAPTK